MGEKTEASKLTKIHNSLEEAYEKISKAQKQIGQNMSQFDKSAHNKQRSNYQKSSNTRLQTKKHWIQRIVTSVTQIKNDGNIFKNEPTVSKKIGKHGEVSTNKELSNQSSQQPSVDFPGNRVICSETAMHDNQRNAEEIFNLQTLRIKS